ncbi:MAG: hypothetical protein JXQ27_07855 [Acidobacteria bacterium]|nr:hypothetical protein [Acidobacteriota bacterium]
MIRHIQEFLGLSASLNYQLSGTPINWQGVLALTVGEGYSPPVTATLEAALDYLNHAYGQTKRRLGPFAVLHPIRTAALLARAHRAASLPLPVAGTDMSTAAAELPIRRLSPLEILTVFLHDKQEDLVAAKYIPDVWQSLEADYQRLLERLPAQEQPRLESHIDILTRHPDELYYNYLGRLLSHGRDMPEVVRTKLADRLDNTLDLRMDLQGISPQTDCYEMIFSILFTQSDSSRSDNSPHPSQGKINGSRRLFQLFKNAVFLSLLRREKLDTLDDTVRLLVDTLARSSIAEAQRNLVHLFQYHLQDKHLQREVLHDVMTYCRAGHISHVTPAGDRHRLDGLFKYRFDHEDRDTRNRHLDDLYQDKVLMAEAALAFMAIFASFRNDPTFRIQGIDARGIHFDPGDK